MPGSTATGRRPPARPPRTAPGEPHPGAPLNCPLCARPGTRPFAEVGGCRYLRCDGCLLTFAHPDDRPSARAEEARYRTHENDPADPRYRAFLARLADPLVERLEPGAPGLDFGSGPGPTLSVMLGERGFPTAVYDPFFAPDETVLDRRYAFVTCTETVEHFFEPGREFERLSTLLRPAGVLGVMTRLLDDDEAFESWWYVRDPTHVAFYRPETLAWIAARWGWSWERPEPTVTLFGAGGRARRGNRT